MTEPLSVSGYTQARRSDCILCDIKTFNYSLINEATHCVRPAISFLRKVIIIRLPFFHCTLAVHCGLHGGFYAAPGQSRVNTVVQSMVVVLHFTGSKQIIQNTPPFYITDIFPHLIRCCGVMTWNVLKSLSAWKSVTMCLTSMGTI